MVEKYTLTGTFDDASTINLTQDAYYWTDDAAIARADNPEGDRTRSFCSRPARRPSTPRSPTGAAESR